MNHPGRTAVLFECRPYIRLIRVFEPDNFRQNYRWQDFLQNIFAAFCVIAMVCALFSVTALMAWNLLENDGDAKVLVVSLPLVMSLTQVFIAFVALIGQNATITEAIDCIQAIVERRESFAIEQRLFLLLSIRNIEIIQR